MSNYRVCMIEVEHHQLVKSMLFDSKEDAEHHAKNQSLADRKHIYEIQKNDKGDFVKIKSYCDGQLA